MELQDIAGGIDFFLDQLLAVLCIVYFFLYAVAIFKIFSTHI